METPRRRRPSAAALEAFLKDSGLSYKTGSKSYIFTCPRCRKPEKLWIFRDGTSFICFKCADHTHFQGAPEYALKELSGRTLAEVRKQLYGVEAVDIDAGALLIDINLNPQPPDDVAEFDFSLDFTPDLAWPLDCHELNTAEGKPGAKYLSGRGIPLEIAMEYDIRYNSIYKSVCFPMLVDGRLLGWQARTTKELLYEVETPEGKVLKERLKSLNTKEMPVERFVMFQDRLKDSEHCVLCEGPVDALKAHFFGGNIATMGKRVRSAQVAHIAKYGIKNVYVALDPDAATSIEALVDDIERFGMTAYKVVIPRFVMKNGKLAKDLGDLPFDVATEAIAEARPLARGQFHFYINFKDVSDCQS
jgi:hypothetical protein